MFNLIGIATSLALLAKTGDIFTLSPTLSHRRDGSFDGARMILRRGQDDPSTGPG
jgi:hypothetical protein